MPSERNAKALPHSPTPEPLYAQGVGEWGSALYKPIGRIGKTLPESLDRYGSSAELHMVEELYRGRIHFTQGSRHEPCDALKLVHQ